MGRRLTRRDRLLIAFGVAGPPLAWALHLILGYGYEEAACSTGTGTDLVEPVVAVLTVILGATCVAAGLSALHVWRSVRSGRVRDPRGRVRTLAGGAGIWSTIFLAIVLLAGSQLLFLEGCAAGASPQLDRGRELYFEGCASCHGRDGRGVSRGRDKRGAGGVDGAGPSLRGVGAASAHLYLTTGYMPLRDPDDRPQRREPPYEQREIDALIDYIASLDGGPPIPDVNPERGSLSEGARAFADHCAACHQMAAEGGVVVGGVAPELERSTPTQIAEAIRIGPHLMPSFSREQIDDEKIDSIARYVEWLKQPRDEGGWGIGHVGPVPEGLVAWLLAAIGLVAVARLISGARR